MTMKHLPRARQDGTTVLLADPQEKRRSLLARRAGHYRVVEAASLPEVYQLSEALSPQAILIAEDFLDEPEIEGIVRLAALLQTTLCAFTDQGAAALRAPLRGQLSLILRQPEDGLPDLLSRVRAPSAGMPGPSMDHGQPDIILLGASTGGIAALETILSSFPADCPPTLVVQHIRDGFIPRLVQRLDNRCPPRIIEGSDGLALRRGTVIFAGDESRHLTVAGKSLLHCALIAAPPCHGHRPAVDPLFESAVPLGARVAAALLTGMGSDGATGLGALRRAGAFTIAQDAATSAVWGMPRVAVETGAADLVLPLPRIAPALLAGRGACISAAARACSS
jgi:two-component system, chemotaxis family, protein-glutamate methylesterase/glutaminase